ALALQVEPLLELPVQLVAALEPYRVAELRLGQAGRQVGHVGPVADLVDRGVRGPGRPVHLVLGLRERQQHVRVPQHDRVRLVLALGERRAVDVLHREDAGRNLHMSPRRHDGGQPPTTPPPPRRRDRARSPPPATGCRGHGSTPPAAPPPPPPPPPAGGVGGV